MAKGDNAVYRVTDVIGTSPNSWEEAARNAVKMASKSLRDLRIAEVTKLDVKVEDGKLTQFRTRLSLSFKYGARLGFSAVVRVTGSAGRFEDFQERVRWLLVRDADAEPCTEHHVPGQVGLRGVALFERLARCGGVLRHHVGREP